MKEKKQTNRHCRIKDLPRDMRPYEKFQEKGPSSLTDQELLSIILKSGTRDKSAMEAAGELLSMGDRSLLNLYQLSLDQLMQVEGIGPVKAMQLKAIGELSIRISSTCKKDRLSMNRPEYIADYYMEKLRHESQEHLYCIFMDNRCCMIGDREITKGSSSQTLVPVDEILRGALEAKATSIVLVHNHPAGDPGPSQNDDQITEQVAQAARLLGLRLDDHIIIGDNCYYSYHESKAVI